MKTWNTAAAALIARAIAGEQIPMPRLLYLGLDTPQRFACCGVPLEWDGQTWAALDVQISEQTDSAVEMAGLTLTQPGVDTGQIALAFEDVDGAALRVYQAVVDPDTGVVEDAVLMWAGELDVPGWQDGQQASVIFSAEHRGTLALRPKVIRYTNDEQQRLYPGDTSLDVDPATDAAAQVWPAASYFRQ